MKLLGSTKNKITKNKNGENVPHLEITEAVLVNCNVLIMIINKIQEYFIHLFQINRLVAYWKFLQTNHIFSKTFNSEHDEIIVWFTDQNSQQLEMEDRINLTMVIK